MSIKISTVQDRDFIENTAYHLFEISKKKTADLSEVDQMAVALYHKMLIQEFSSDLSLDWMDITSLSEISYDLILKVKFIYQKIQVRKSIVFDLHRSPQVRELFQKLLDKWMDNRSLDLLGSFLAKFSEERKISFLQMIQGISLRSSDCESLFVFIGFLEKMSQDQGEDVCLFLKKYLAEVDLKQTIQIAKKWSKIPLEQRTLINEVLPLILSFPVSFVRLNSIVDFLIHTEGVVSLEFRSIIDMDIEDDDLSDWIVELCKMPFDQIDGSIHLLKMVYRFFCDRVEVEKICLLVLQSMICETEIEKYLDFCASFPNDAQKKMFFFLISIRPSFTESIKQKVLRVAPFISSKDFWNLEEIELCMSLLFSLPEPWSIRGIDQEIISIFISDDFLSILMIKILCKNPSLMNKEFISRLFSSEIKNQRDLWKELNELVHVMNAIDQALHLLQMIPQGEWKEIIHWIIRLKQERKSEEEIISIITVLSLFPSQCREDILHFSSDCLFEETKWNWLHNILVRKPELISLFHSYLFKRVMHEPSKYFTRSCAQYFFEAPWAFFLNEESFLGVILSFIRMNQNHPLDPYKIYERHQSQALIHPSSSSFQTIEEGEYRVNIEGFLSHESTIIAKEELMEKCPNKAMFIDFIAEMQSISEQDKEEVFFITGKQLNELCQNMMDPFIQHLLDLEKVDTVCSCFYAILRFLFDQCHEKKRGLTERQQMFLQISNSIQGCSAGKSEGIVLFYQSLPIQYHLNFMKDVKIPIELKTRRYIYDQIIQGIIEEISSESRFMKEVTQTEEIAQLAHQSLFVKNMLSSCVGIPHPITFDIHTYLLYPILVERDLNQFFEIFFTHFTPMYFIDRVQDIIRFSPIEIGLYQGINQILLDQMPLDEIWHSDESNFQITQKGACKLLNTLEFLSVKKM